MPTAERRWAEVTVWVTFVVVLEGRVKFVVGVLSEPLASGVEEGEEGEVEKREVGCAMRTTPKRETRPAICSVRVKGSWRRTEQAQQAKIGARKVMTVASERGRYSRET